MQKVDSKSPYVPTQKQTDRVDSIPMQFEEDTINLYEISLTLWKRKWIVIALTLVAALVSILHALQQPRIYKSEALLLPPAANNLLGLNLLETRETHVKIPSNISSEEVFNKFKLNLKSRTIHKKFILKYGLNEILDPEKSSKNRDEEVYNGFSNLIVLEEKKGATSFSISQNNGEIAAKWINDLTEFVDKETINQLVQDKQQQIESRIQEIEYTIKSKRLMAAKRREDQIIRYTEHAEIAKKLGMIGHVEATNLIENTQMNADVSTSAIRRKSTSTSPLYYLGYEALMTEINVLRNRKSDDPFIEGLRDLQEELAMLRTIKFDTENMSAVHVDQAAYPPTNAFAPNRRLIASFGTVIGFFAGIFLVFLVEYVTKQKKMYSG